jgi:hypothetical protein
MAGKRQKRPLTAVTWVRIPYALPANSSVDAGIVVCRAAALAHARQPFCNPLATALSTIRQCAVALAGHGSAIRAGRCGAANRLHHRYLDRRSRCLLLGASASLKVEATGSLISAALANEVVRRPFFRSSLAKIIRSGEQDAVVEHRLLDVFIALDTLCDAYETKRQPHLSKLLSVPAYKQVRDIVDRAVRELGELESSAKDQGVADILRGVKNRVGAAPFRTERGFAQALLRLMDRFGLADRQVIESQFPTDIRSGRTSDTPIEAWISLISRYRSIVVHNGASSTLRWSAQIILIRSSPISATC